MARPLRIEYAGAVYHVMARGNQGLSIFRDDQDRQRFLETVGEACEKTGWRFHAYVLMGNHYHLLVETSEGNLVAGMKWLQGAYTQRFNGRHKVFGHLFQARYKAVVEKTVLTGWLRERTTVPLYWVSQELAMGHYTRVTQAISRMKRKPAKELQQLKRQLLQTEKQDA
jgi:REP element-mobilizing transposase RayT